jgi:Flp pilus assembly protein TadG
MIRKLAMKGDERGVSAVEFALALPMLLTFVLGTAQLGKLFFSNADMRQAAAAGARVASIFPVPDDDTILDAVDERLVRSGAVDASTVALTKGTDASGNPYVDISITYTVPLDFVFFQVSPVTLNETRRVFTQVASPNTTQTTTSTSTSSTGGTTTSSTTTSSTTSGGTTSSSWGGTTSSTGGTTSSTGSSTSSTSTSSTGGTTSSTGGTTSSTGGTTSSSSGNGNGTSSSGGGHGHGRCRRC